MGRRRFAFACALALVPCLAGCGGGSASTETGTIALTGFAASPMAGGVPTPFVLSGTGFAGALGTIGTEVVVTFEALEGTPFAGGTSAVADVAGVVSSPTTVSGTTPPAALCSGASVSANVRVVFEGGLTASSEGVFTVAFEAPTLVSFSTGPVFAGVPAAFVLTGSGFGTGPVIVRFTGAAGTTPFQGGTEASVDVACAAAGTSVSGTTPEAAACGAESVAASVQVLLPAGACTAILPGLEFLPPAATFVVPAGIPALEGAPFTITGTGFGPVGSPALVRLLGDDGALLFESGTVNETDVSAVVTSSTTVVGVAPSAAVVGTPTATAAARVVLAGGACVETGPGFVTYVAPTLESFSVSGAPVDPARPRAALVRLPAPFTIAGTGFAPVGGLVTVRFDGIGALPPGSRPYAGGTSASESVTARILGPTAIEGTTPALAATPSFEGAVRVTFPNGTTTVPLGPGAGPLWTAGFARRAGGAGPTREATAVAALPDGSFVAAGKFVGSMVLGALEPNETTLVAAGGPGDSDAFVARYDAGGRLRWARSAGGTGPSGDSAEGVALFPDGSVAVVGSFAGSASFGGVGLAASGGTGDRDAFVARYDAQGTVVWAERAGGVGHERARGVASFADGSCVVTGETASRPASFGAGEPGATSLTPVGGHDVFLARYRADGTLAWARAAGGAYEDSGAAVASFADGTSAVTGSFTRAATFGPGEPNATVLAEVAPPSSLLPRSVFVARFDASGNLLGEGPGLGHARRASPSSGLPVVSPAVTEGLAVSAFPDGSFVVGGRIVGAILFGIGESGATDLVPVGGAFDEDAFVARFRADATLAWARNAGSVMQDRGAFGVAALPDGSCALCGAFTGSATFGSGEPGQVTLDTSGVGDAFLAHYASDGRLSWAVKAGGPGDDAATAVAALPDGSTVAAGFVGPLATFGFGTANATTLTGVGPVDSAHAFVARHDPFGEF